MRCIHCRCNKGAGAFFRAGKKAVGMRVCSSCKDGDIAPSTSTTATQAMAWAYFVQFGSVAVLLLVLVVVAAVSGLLAASVLAVSMLAAAAINWRQRSFRAWKSSSWSGLPAALSTAWFAGDTDAASAEKEGTARACSACGKQLVDDVNNPQDWKMCGRCKQAFYCGKACQVEHWRRGGHKQACKEPMACCICLDNDGPPLPIQCGCGCRNEAGCAHIACKIAYAKHQGPGYHKDWYDCSTCKQEFNGAMQLGLAEALWSLLKGRPAKDQHRMGAQNTLAAAYNKAGRFSAANVVYRNVLATLRRTYGPNHENTLKMAANLGSVLNNQDNPKEAEVVFRDAYERQRQTVGSQHEDTLSAAGGLAVALQKQRKYAEAEPVLRDTLAIQQRVHGEDCTNTLGTATNLALLLSYTGQYAEAEELVRGALARANRVLGPKHPTSLQITRILAETLGCQGEKVKEAEDLFTAVIATQQRVLGYGHPDTQKTELALRLFKKKNPALGWERF